MPRRGSDVGRSRTRRRRARAFARRPAAPASGGARYQPARMPIAAPRADYERPKPGAADARHEHQEPADHEPGCDRDHGVRRTCARRWWPGPSPVMESSGIATMARPTPGEPVRKAAHRRRRRTAPHGESDQAEDRRGRAHGPHRERDTPRRSGPAHAGRGATARSTDVGLPGQRHAPGSTATAPRANAPPASRARWRRAARKSATPRSSDDSMPMA